MSTVLRPVGHEDRLSVIDHLDELRTRLVVCAVTLVVAFGFCFWQNAALLDVLNRPLEESTPNAHSAGSGRLAKLSASQTELGRQLARAAAGAEKLSAAPRLTPANRAAADQLAAGLAGAARVLPKTFPERKPITTGVGEPFTATLTVALYFAILFSLPVILWQAYAFVLPAFSARERRVVLPLMAMVPFLFAAGVAFGYFLVLPPAINFLQNFNSDSFDVLIQARDYYKFAIMTIGALGLMFQIPVGLLALNRAGILSSRTLTSQWRYIVVIIAIIAALLPGVDPVTTTLEMIPLLLLYALSILLLKLAERRDPPEDRWDLDDESLETAGRDDEA